MGQGWRLLKRRLNSRIGAMVFSQDLNYRSLILFGQGEKLHFTMPWHFVGISIFWVIGSILLYWTYLAFSKTARFLRRSLKVQGQVVRYEEKMEQPSRGSPYKMYYPVIDFRAQAGQQRSFTAASGNIEPLYEIGETVRVVYDPSNETEVKIYSLVGLWLGPCGLALLAADFLAIGLFFVLALVKW